MPRRGVPVDAHPISPNTFDGVTVRTGGWTFLSQAVQRPTFWQALDAHGGSWMWEKMTDIGAMVPYVVTYRDSRTIRML